MHGTSNSCGLILGVKNKRSDGAGCILILDITIDDTDYLLINIYNVETYMNIETDQIKVLNNLRLLLDRLDIRQNKQIILAGDWNLFLNITLGVKGGSPCLKRNL